MAPIHETNVHSNQKKKLWIDLDNSPHVPFFSPIIRELRCRGYSVMITARDCFQVCGLADLYQLPYKRIGMHYGKNKLMKGIGLIIRSVQLAPIVIQNRPTLAISHGSRSQILLSALLNFPSLLLLDYEYSQKIAAPTWVMMPEAIAAPLFQFDKDKIIHYPGIKEDVYVPEFKPDPSIKAELGLNPQDVIATIRPPATEAHYHNPESEFLFSEVISTLGNTERVTMVILPRNDRQAVHIRSTWPDYIRSGKIKIPTKVINGLNLIWHSDLVISGGGTINREAAALGIPVYSIFRGKLGAIDNYLSQIGKLRIITNDKEVRHKIKITSRKQSPLANQGASAALKKIVESISEIAEGKCHGEANCGIPQSGFAEGAPYQAIGRRPGQDV